MSVGIPCVYTLHILTIPVACMNLKDSQNVAVSVRSGLPTHGVGSLNNRSTKYQVPWRVLSLASMSSRLHLVAEIDTTTLTYC